jgi:Ca2+-binding EF-hand superfamily protein
MKMRPLLLLSVFLVSASAQDAGLQKKLEQGFTTFDQDHDAALNAAEFNALGEYSPKLKGKPQVVDYLFQTLDANRDGKLSHDEYMNIVAISGAEKPSPEKPAIIETKSSAEQIAFFEKKIRPVLAEKCYKCHAQDSEKIKGGLVLDTREGIRRGGDSGPGVVPGDLVKSLVIESLHYTNKDMQMPPEKSGGKLPDSVIADFEH